MRYLETRIFKRWDRLKVNLKRLVFFYLWAMGEVEQVSHDFLWEENSNKHSSQNYSDSKSGDV